jgi:hypothetical protein
MFTLHHPHRVLCAQVLHKVNFQKNPTAADLCARDFAATELPQQRFRVDV